MQIIIYFHHMHTYHADISMEVLNIIKIKDHSMTFKFMSKFMYKLYA